MITPFALIAMLVSGSPSFALLAGGVTGKSHLRSVKMVFVEALDPKDTTSSKRFQEEYEAAIAKGRELTVEPLSACGYQLDTKSYLYAASDPIQAKEQAEKAVREGAWLIVGPRRSNHYLLLAKGADTTPTVSLMASSEEVALLGPLHLSMAPSNAMMAKVAAHEAKQRLAGANNEYLSLVSADCLACKDFAKHFDQQATRLGMSKLAEFPILGNQPDLTNARDVIARKSPAFVLVPNYSIVTSYVISELRSARPGIFFVGGDGWGTAKYGFVQNGRELIGASGLSVRGDPPVEAGLKRFRAGKILIERRETATFGSATALNILRTIDGVASFLCESKPKIAEAFAKKFAAKGSKYFSAPWGVSVYKLENGNIVFLKSREAR
jgi:hypothetical protein